MSDGNSQSLLEGADLPEYLRPRKRPAQERSQHTVEVLLAAAARILARGDAASKDALVAALLLFVTCNAAFSLTHRGVLKPQVT